MRKIRYEEDYLVIQAKEEFYERKRPYKFCNGVELDAEGENIIVYYDYNKEIYPINKYRVLHIEYGEVTEQLG